VRLSRRAAHARYDALLAAGVRIWEYERTTLHAKTFVVDGLWSSVGTMNFDNRSLALNDESTLMILDASFAQRMEEQFQKDIRNATSVDPEAFARRPWTDHAIEWAANLMTRVI
ncbi:MAG TPA: phospholipase D-like domain-containing protein, partial [Gemmatimonadaceae bacterium]|nr:phospholipase D-like domain-containing protein [Gemmatimonadaceae bacterium]